MKIICLFCPSFYWFSRKIPSTLHSFFCELSKTSHRSSLRKISLISWYEVHFSRSNTLLKKQLFHLTTFLFGPHARLDSLFMLKWRNFRPTLVLCKFFKWSLDRLSFWDVLERGAFKPLSLVEFWVECTLSKRSQGYACQLMRHFFVGEKMRRIMSHPWVHYALILPNLAMFDSVSSTNLNHYHLVVVLVFVSCQENDMSIKETGNIQVLAKPFNQKTLAY